MNSQSTMTRIISRGQIEQAVGIPDIIDAVEQANRLVGRGETVSDFHHTLFEGVDPSRLPQPHANFQSFSAYIKGDIDIHGIACPGSCPHNSRDFGLPYITGVLVLNNRATGVPVAVMDMSRLVELVTAAVSAVGSKYLASSTAAVLGVLGCGNQGRIHLDAIKCVRDITKAVVFDANRDVLDKYVREMGERTGLEVGAAKSAEEVTRQSDILAIVISSPVPVVKYEWIKPGALVIAASGFGQELYIEDCFRNIDKLVMDDWASILDACIDDVGAKPEDRNVYTALLSNWKKWNEGQDPAQSPDPLLKGEYGIDLPAVVLGARSGRENPTDRIIFIHAGVSANMVVAGHAVYRNAQKKNVGAELSLL